MLNELHELGITRHRDHVSAMILLNHGIELMGHNDRLYALDAAIHNGHDASQWILVDFEDSRDVYLWLGY